MYYKTTNQALEQNIQQIFVCFFWEIKFYKDLRKVC